MTTTFDTTRLDEECERIAWEHPWQRACEPYILAAEVKAMDALEAINAPRKITGSMACKIYAGMRQGKDVWQCMEPIACSWIASRVEGERRPTHRRASHGKLLKAAVQEGAGFSPNAEISKPAPSISFADDEKEEKI